MMAAIEDRIAGCLVGGAIGDAMGLPFEGRPGPLQYVPADVWMISDDTQLTIATCEAIVENEEISPESIANKFCNWFRDGRISGIGASTFKALSELAAGGHWALVGRKGEMAAGNGAAMRVAPLGFFLDPTSDEDRTTLRDVCRITHHSDEAYIGGLAVVAAVHLVVFKQQELAPSLLDSVARFLSDSNVKDRIAEIRAFADGKTIEECARRFGSSGYVVESVPLAILAATKVSHLGFAGALEAAIECGGDTDTTASITGQIAGAVCGLSRLPSDLVRCVPELERIEALAHRLSLLVESE